MPTWGGEGWGLTQWELKQNLAFQTNTDLKSTPLLVGLLVGFALSISLLGCRYGSYVEFDDGYMKLANEYVLRDDSGRLARVLSDNNAPIDSMSHDGNTLLMIAAREGSIKSARVLLNRAADPNFYSTVSKSTPLVEATQYYNSRSIPMVDLLLENGAQVDKYLTDPDSMKMPDSPLTNASILSLKMTEHLLAAGADPNLMAGNGTAIATTFITANKEMLALMICKGGG